MTVIDDVARWVSTLRLEDIPERVREVARNQLMSVMGAVCAGAGCAGGRAVIDTVAGLADEGPCTAFPSGEGRPFQSALLQNSSLSMALDYDDYLFLGHTGHSAVMAPLAAAQLRGADTATVLTAQVAANEVAGRLGGSVVLGPHNGQMWAHIHLMGAAAGAARVMGLGPEETANALGIAMAEPVYALFPGFMGPQSKLLTAAVPTVTGMTAALLAEKGMTGSRVIIEDPEGFWAHFSFIPLPFMMTGLGRSWVTDTIAFKPYPGCAYVDTSVDAMLEILREFEAKTGRALEAGEVREVNVCASLLTIAMDTMSAGYLDPLRLSPTNINFSLSVSLAIVLMAGTLSGAQLTEEFLTSNREEILEAAARVRLEHDASLSVEFVRSLGEVMDLQAMVEEIALRDLWRARSRLRQHLGKVGTMSLRDAIAAWKSLDWRDKAFVRSLVHLRGVLGKPHVRFDLGDALFDEISMPFGARVSVRLKDGTVLEAEKMIPRGGPGDDGRLDVPPEKFTRESAAFLSPEQARAAIELIRGLEGSSLEEVTAALSAVAD